MFAELTATHYISIVGIALSVATTVVTVAFKRFDDRNTRQHAEAMDARKNIEKKIDATHDLLVEHIVWHGQNPHSSYPKEVA